MTHRHLHMPHLWHMQPLSTKQLGLFTIMLGMLFVVVFLILMWLLYTAH